MRISFFFTLCVLVSLFANGQSERRVLTGKITDGENVVVNVHVINETTNRGTLTTSSGEFKIPVHLNDTLVFSEIRYKLKQVVINRNILETGKLDVQLEVNINKLDEVVIFKNKQVFNPLGLPNQGKITLNKEEREMNYYSQKSAPMVILDALLLTPLLNIIPFTKKRQGGIDDVYYVLSGERKKFRKLQSLKQQDEINAYNLSVCQAIRKHFGDDFFAKTLKIHTTEIEPFLLSCIPRNIVSLYNEKRELELVDVLVSEAPRFKPD